MEKTEEGKVVEVMVETKGGMGQKKGRKNPWNTPSQSSGSEPETGCSSAEERDDEKLQEVLERKVTQAGTEGVEGEERSGREGDD